MLLDGKPRGSRSFTSNVTATLRSRRTLLSTTTVLPDYHVTQSGITAMYNDFNALPTDGSVLVLVALQASAGTIPSSLIGQPSTTNPPSLQTALAKIGGVVPPTYQLVSGSSACWASNVLKCYGYVSHGSTATWRLSPNRGTINDLQQGPSR